MDLDHPPLPEQSLSFLILGQRVRVGCSDPELRGILTVNFGAMATPNDDVAPDLQYWIVRGDTSSTYSLVRDGRESCEDAEPADILFLLEKDITVEVQKRRSDLFFLHSAAIDWRGNACLLAAESGSGKSTTAWALLHHAFRYLSDELSPLDLDSMCVFPYPHALCLKQEPPPAYALPATAIHSGHRIHIPAEALPGAAVLEPLRLGAVFLLTHRPDRGTPELRAIGRAEASARLYVTALNALAHPSRGLDAVVRISERVPCFAVSSADLAATCALIGSTVEQVIGSRAKAT
jgi:hypothetical protein